MNPETPWSTWLVPTDRVSAEEFARMLNWPMTLFEDQRERGLMPAPEGVFEKRPYWTQAQVAEMRDAIADGIRAAWGHNRPKEADNV